MIIDADGHTHVANVVFDEYLDPAFRAKRPRYVELDDGRCEPAITLLLVAKDVHRHQVKVEERRPLIIANALEAFK